MVEQIPIEDFHERIFKHFDTLGFTAFHDQASDELIFIDPSFKPDKKLNHTIHHSDTTKISGNDFSYLNDDTTVSIYSKNNINESLYNQFCLQFLLNTSQYTKSLLENYIYSDFIFEIPTLLKTKEQLKNFFVNFPLYHVNDDHNIINIFNFMSNINQLSKEDKQDIIKYFYLSHQDEIEFHANFPYIRDYIVNYFKEEPEQLEFFTSHSKLFNHHLNKPVIEYIENVDNKININPFNMAITFNTDYLTHEHNLNILQAFIYSFINNYDVKDIKIKNKDSIINDYLSVHNNELKVNIVEIDFNNHLEKLPIFINLLDIYFKEIKKNQPPSNNFTDISNIIDTYGWGTNVDSFISYHLISDNINSNNHITKKIKL